MNRNRPTRVAAGGLLALSLTSVPLAAQAAAPPSPDRGRLPVPSAVEAEGCPSPASVSSRAKSGGAETLYNRLIELRYDPNTRCAWGRIQNGSAGDSVWVDRSSDKRNATDLSKYGGRATIAAGSTSAFTPQAFSDKGVYMRACGNKGVYMRACGKASNRSTIVCTPWY